MDFWEMTIAELERAINSKLRVDKARAKERACYDYILASLVGANVIRSMSTGVEIPTVEEAYSFLFEEERKKAEEEKQARLEELSILRFKQFANSYNERFK